MSLVISIFGSILAIFVVIILHEMGHFFVARLFNIKILKFSIGFGKALYTRIGKDGTAYVLAMIPLGGYVKMLGENDSQKIPEADRKRTYNSKPLLVRMAVVLAGPAVNFLLAILVFWGAYLIGVQHIKPIVGRVTPNSIASKAGIQPGDQIIKVGDRKTYNWQQVVLAMLVHIGDAGKTQLTIIPKGAEKPIVRSIHLLHWDMNKRKPQIFKSLGFYPYTPKIAPVIRQVMPGSPAAIAGLKSKDRIKSINGKPMDAWQQVIMTVRELPDKKVVLGVQRKNKLMKVTVHVGAKSVDKERLGYLGVMVVAPKHPKSLLYLERYNVFTAWKPAAIRTWNMLKYNALVLLKMVTGKLSFKTMGGPISIFQAAGQATQAGVEVYLSFIGFISLTVGFINLLPIPGLDGGHFFFQVIEAIIRRPVSDRVQQVGFTLGMLLVIFVVLNATFNDLFRIFA